MKKQCLHITLSRHFQAVTVSFGQSKRIVQVNIGDPEDFKAGYEPSFEVSMEILGRALCAFFSLLVRFKDTCIIVYE